MARGRMEFHWELQSHLMALLVNLKTDLTRHPPCNPDRFNPYRAADAIREDTSLINNKSSEMIGRHLAAQERASGKQAAT